MNKVPWPPPIGHQFSISQLHKAARRANTPSTPKSSSRLVNTLAHLSDLRRQFIVVRQPPVYSGAEHNRARAFVVLSHAALEDYLEGIALEVVDSSLRAFKADQSPRTSLLALLTYAADAEPANAFAGGQWGIRGHLQDSRQALRQWTERNNGLKAKDVLRLLLPVGIKESDLGATWLQHMDDLGELRGRVAHKANLPGAQAPLDPHDALEAVARVLPNLCRVDAKLCALRDE